MRISLLTKCFIAFFCCVFLSLPVLFSQSNNECSNAQQVVNPENFCSPIEAAHNLFATASSVPAPGCFINTQHDVWFWFIAQAPNVVVVINGSSASAGGSLLAPEVALYEGACDALNLLGCESDPAFVGVTELRVDGLTPGDKYFFRVDGEIPGTFQFCVRNFFFDGGISGDCPTAIPLCDKKPFNVQAVAGPGMDPNELNDAPCFGGAIGAELNSTWYAFTAANNGTLEFKLTPNNAGDDLDFIVYRLPNGMGDCTDKIIERCMAAGDFTANSPCMGATGLNAASTAVEHGPGCLVPDDNNFLRYMDVQAGNTYALVVNNFTSSGNGFQVEWGGTVEFVGPVAAIETNQPDDVICLGDTIRFTDATTVNQGILTDWGWTFGEGASQNIAVTQGPHDIVYQTLGQKIITLNVKSSLGCDVNDLRLISVEDCCLFMVSVNVISPCQSTTASAGLQVEGAELPLTYQWSNGQQDSVATGLTAGDYSVTVSDANGCQEIATFSVPPLVNFTATFPEDTLIITGTSATLAVGTNNPAVQVSWTPVSGGTALSGNPLVFQPTTSNTYLVNASIGDCSLTDSVTVTVRNNFFEMPNAFTPNGDQVNDRFRPILYAGTVVNLSVWSRWGELIYEGNSSDGWDGTFEGEVAPSEVYVYVLLVRLPNGEEENRHGDVTLIR